MFCMIWILEAGHGPQVGLRSFALMLMVLFAVMAHELGHALVAVKHGIKVRSVVLLPIAGISMLDEQAQRGMDARREILIALAGPVVNLALAVLIGSSILIFRPQVQLFSFPWLTPFDLPRSFGLGTVIRRRAEPAAGLSPGRRTHSSRRAGLQRRPGYGHAPSRFHRTVLFPRTISLRRRRLLRFQLQQSVDHDGRRVSLPGSPVEDRSMILQAVLERVRVRDVMITDFVTLSPAETLAEALQRSMDPPQRSSPWCAAQTW